MNKIIFSFLMSLSFLSSTTFASEAPADVACYVAGILLADSTHDLAKDVGLSSDSLVAVWESSSPKHAQMGPLEFSSSNGDFISKLNGNKYLLQTANKTQYLVLVNAGPEASYLYKIVNKEIVPIAALVCNLK